MRIVLFDPRCDWCTQCDESVMLVHFPFTDGASAEWHLCLECQDHARVLLESDVRTAAVEDNVLVPRG
jgi:hypothetical protein